VGRIWDISHDHTAPQVYAIEADERKCELQRDCASSVQPAVAGNEHMTIMLALAVNIGELVRFESVVPWLHRMIGGHYKWERVQAAPALTISDAAFAVDFATKFALTVQGRMPRPE